MKLIHSLALGALLLSGMPAYAQESPAAADETPQFLAQARTPETTTRINPMSDEQRKQLSALKDRYQLDTAEKKALLEVTQRQLRDTLGATTVDKGAATALQAKINALRADLSNARLNFMLAAGDVFTPEQRAAFKSMRGHWGHGRGGHRGHGGGCGGGDCGPGGHGHGGHGAHGGPQGGKPPVG